MKVFKQFMYLSCICSSSLSCTIPENTKDYFLSMLSTLDPDSAPSCVVSMATTLRHTYSCMVSRKFLKVVMTLVIFSTMVPTSCRSWSMVMGRPIMEVRQVCSVTRLVATWTLWMCRYGRYSRYIRYSRYTRYENITIVTSWCGSAVAPSEWVVPMRLLPWIAWCVDIVDTG